MKFVVYSILWTKTIWYSLLVIGTTLYIGMSALPFSLLLTKKTTSLLFYADMHILIDKALKHINYNGNIFLSLTSDENTIVTIYIL